MVQRVSRETDILGCQLEVIKPWDMSGRRPAIVHVVNSTWGTENEDMILFQGILRRVNCSMEVWARKDSALSLIRVI